MSGRCWFISSIGLRNTTRSVILLSCGVAVYSFSFSFQFAHKCIFVFLAVDSVGKLALSPGPLSASHQNHAGPAQPLIASLFSWRRSSRSHSALVATEFAHVSWWPRWCWWRAAEFTGCRLGYGYGPGPRARCVVGRRGSDVVGLTGRTWQWLCSRRWCRWFAGCRRRCTTSSTNTTAAFTRADTRNQQLSLDGSAQRIRRGGLTAVAPAPDLNLNVVVFHCSWMF